MSSDDIVISAHNLTKTYRIFAHSGDRVKQAMTFGLKKYHSGYTAVRDLSFDIRRGEIVGIIGSNGSGKSTLLQLICGILKPTTGAIEVNGRVSALLELWAGFNPEFTGRENIYFQGALLGLKKTEVDRLFESIAAFADIGQFIEQPVRTYSSGMFVRLAFSMVILGDPDVLIIDEALSVGDAVFQHKCIKHMTKLRNRGVTILFVSHDIGTVKNFCNRGLLLNKSQLILDSGATHVAEVYQSEVRRHTSSSEYNADEKGGADTLSLAKPGEIIAVKLGENIYNYGDDIKVEIDYRLNDLSARYMIGCALYRDDNTYVCGLNTKIDNIVMENVCGIKSITLNYINIQLLSGKYNLKIAIFDHTGTVCFDFYDFAAEFSIVTPYVGDGVVILDHEWRIDVV